MEKERAYHSQCDTWPKKKTSIYTHLAEFYSIKVLMESDMMEEREYSTYRSLFSNMSNFM